MSIRYCIGWGYLCRLTVLVVTFLCLFHFSVAAENRAKSLEEVEDSLVSVLKTMPRDTAYLKMIGTIEQLLLNTPRFLYYAELKEKEALLLNMPKYVCSSMSDRAIHYSNRSMIDSFYYWKRKMDPLALELKEYSYYFFLRTLEVTLLLKEGKIEKAMQTANQMYDEAKNYNSTEGLIAANLSIGRALLTARKYGEAIVSYETALSLMGKNNSRLNASRMQAYNYLAILFDITDESERGLALAAEQEEFINDLQKLDVGKVGPEAYLINVWVDLQLKKASFNVKLHNPGKALAALNDATKNYEKVRKETQQNYHQTWANYYEEICQYNNALDALNYAYPESFPGAINASQLMEQKARLLGYLGRKDEAIKLYRETLILKDSISNQWFDSQLNELRTIYETDHLKLKNKELELRNKHTQLQTIQISLAFTILVLLVIVFLFVRSNRLKRELEDSEKGLIWEKDLLIKSEQELRIAKEKAEKARDIALKAELKESFLANMSHEIRTPLNAIVGFSNLLVSDEELEPGERSMFINTINQNCDLLLKLIGDILDLSRMEAGKMSFKLEDCSLTDLVEDVYRTHKMMIPAGIEFQKTYPQTAAFANTDCLRIKQVMTNFINNAVKFTPAGYIRIGYELNPEEQTVSLFVEDTGKGIPENKQEKIFERFYKQNDFDQGTGLGLSICTVIAEKLNGKLTIKSKPGEGSRFAIVIPYKN